MADQTKKYNKNEERTFKDDVLSLINTGKNDDYFTYYVVSMVKPYTHGNTYIDKLFIREEAISLACYTDRIKAIVSNSIVYHDSLAFPERIKGMVPIYRYFLSNQIDKRHFIAYHYLNLRNQDFGFFNIFLNSSIDINPTCVVYYPFNKSSKEEINLRVNAFKELYNKTIPQHNHDNFAYIAFLFYKIFFNKYSDVGLMDNYCSYLRRNKDALSSLPISITDTSNEGIKNAILTFYDGRN